MQQSKVQAKPTLLVRSNAGSNDLKKKITELEQEVASLNRERAQRLFGKICFPNSDGFIFLESERIIRCESDGNYTRIIIENGKSLYISKTLKQIELILASASFYRVHKSHIVNMNKIDKIFRNNGASIQLTNKEIVPISRNRKEDFFKLIFK